MMHYHLYDADKTKKLRASSFQKSTQHGKHRHKSHNTITGYTIKVAAYWHKIEKQMQAIKTAKQQLIVDWCNDGNIGYDV
jgi:hypothetical protein